MIPTRTEWEETLVARHGRELQQKLAKATVAICGLGGLGSNIAIALARAGIGRLILVDFDRVDISNLHRQQYKADQVGLCKTEALSQNLQEIAPYLSLEAVTIKLGRENLQAVLAGADVVCEAFDRAEAKAMLVDGVLAGLPACRLVAASGMAGLDTPNTIKTRRVTDRFYLCGDGVSEAGTGESLWAPRVMACAAHQAQTVLRLLAGRFEV